MALEIVVDDRERALITAFASDSSTSTGISISSKRLDIGDVEVRVGGELVLLVERKTLADLSASICDGRYAEQRHRMLGTAGADRVAYVVEGAWPRLFYDARMVGDDAPRVQGALTAMLAAHRIPVAFTRDPADTAAFLLRAAAMLSEGISKGEGQEGHEHEHGRGHEAALCRSAAAASKKSDNVCPRRCYLMQLCQIPGVSYRIASAIAESFGTMRGLIRELEEKRAAGGSKAALAALQAVPHVGKQLAARLTEFLTGPPKEEEEKGPKTVDELLRAFVAECLVETGSEVDVLALSLDDAHGRLASWNASKLKTPSRAKLRAHLDAALGHSKPTQDASASADQKPTKGLRKGMYHGWRLVQVQVQKPLGQEPSGETAAEQVGCPVLPA